MITWLLTKLSGFWGYLAASLAGALLASISIYAIMQNIATADIDALKTTIAQSQAASATTALNQLQSFISTMQTANTNYSASLDAINAQFAVVEKGLKNATAKPLPVDCKPDAARLRILSDAVTATRIGAAASQ